jgi:DMSO/TMAO reductase YedYZ heme-binding membrane subunit
VEGTANLVFIIAAFALALVLIWSRNRVPQRIRRSLAILSTVLVLFAFFLIVYSFLAAGS